MWRWSLNWGEITDSIVIGTCPMNPSDLQRIHSEAGVSGVLSLQHGDCLAYWDIDHAAIQHMGGELGLWMERCPIRDFDVPDMRRHLPDAIQFLTAMIQQDFRVYVHCTAGIGRAPLTVLGYLALVEGIAPEAALRRIRAGRPEAAPPWEAFEGCRRDLADRYREAIGRLAYTFYEQGTHGDARTDWIQAEKQILRAVLSQGAPR